MKTRPKIGITLDAEGAGGYSKLPWYALRQNYCEAVEAAGGLPLPLCHFPDGIHDYAATLDGLIITGGAFDIDPALYGAAAHPTVTQKPARTQFEAGILRAMLAQNKPVLGICGGQQLLAVLLGASLIQHIPDDVPNCLAHEQPNPRTEAGHTVQITPGTLLHRITGVLRQDVNSAHHQAVGALGTGGLVVNAAAADGVTEGIEHPAYKFCLGVQWHPEYHICPGDTALFAAFVRAAIS